VLLKKNKKTMANNTEVIYYISKKRYVIKDSYDQTIFSRIVTVVFSVPELMGTIERRLDDCPGGTRSASSTC